MSGLKNYRMEIIKEEKKDLRLSYSGISTYNECPWRYNLKYNLKIRTNQISALPLIIGSAVHVVVQEWLKAIYNVNEREGLKIKIAERVVEEIKKIILEEKKKFPDSKLPFTKEELKEQSEKYIDILYLLRNRRRKYFPLKGWELVGIELPLEHIYEHNNNKIVYNGFIDVVLKSKQNKYYVMDIKTSAHGWNDYKKKDPNVKSQVHFYKHFYSQQYNIPIEQMEVSYFIIKRDPRVFEDMAPKYFQEFTPAQAKLSIKKTLNQLNVFMDNVFSETPKYPKIAEACRFCDYKDSMHCNPNERISMVELSKQVFIENTRLKNVKKQK